MTGHSSSIVVGRGGTQPPGTDPDNARSRWTNVLRRWSDRVAQRQLTNLRKDS
jgi:hypothetical protein